MTDNATSLRLKAVDALDRAQAALALAASHVNTVRNALLSPGLARHHVLSAIGATDCADEHLDAANSALAQRDVLLNGPPTSQVLDKLAAALDTPEPPILAMTTHDGAQVFVVAAWKVLPLADTGLVDTDVRLAGQVRKIARVLRLDPIQPGERIGLVVDPLPRATLKAV